MSFAPLASGWIAAHAPSSAPRTASTPAADSEHRGRVDDQRVGGAIGGGAERREARTDGLTERPCSHHADPDALEDARPQDLCHARRSSRRCRTTPLRPTDSSCAYSLRTSSKMAFATCCC